MRYVIGLMLSLGCVLQAQVTLVDGQYEHLRQRATTPKTIPATIEDVFTNTAWVEEIVLTNPSAGAVEVTIADKQSPTPVEILKVDVPAKGVVHSTFKGRYAPGGVTWVAASAAVKGYIKARN